MSNSGQDSQTPTGPFSAGGGAGAANQPHFAIQRIYIKDLSFEAPNTPAIFNEEWKPHIDINLGDEVVKLQESFYEVVLKLTVTVKSHEKTAFICEVQHAGIFTIHNVPEGDLDRLLGAFCPNTIFPFTREVVAEMINKGGFPPLYLAPINFEALYEHRRLQKANAKGTTNGGTTH